MKEPAFEEKLAKLGLAVDYRPEAQFIYVHGWTKRRNGRQMIPAMGIPQVD